MMANRSMIKKGKRKSDLKETELCSGPSKLCQALNVTKDGFNGMDMTDSESSLWLEAEEDLKEEDIFVSTRIGIDSRGQKVASLPYRFYVKDNPHVSQLDPRDKAERKKKLKLAE
jgi:DNA-3-methyladenine glycosylase